MERNAHRAFCGSHLPAETVVRNISLSANEVGREPRELVGPPGLGVLALEPCACPVEQRQSPLSFEHPLRIIMVGDACVVSALEHIGLERHSDPVASSLLGTGTIAEISAEVLE